MRKLELVTGLEAPQHLAADTRVGGTDPMQSVAMLHSAGQAIAPGCATSLAHLWRPVTEHIDSPVSGTLTLNPKPQTLNPKPDVNPKDPKDQAGQTGAQALLPAAGHVRRPRAQGLRFP